MKPLLIRSLPVVLLFAVVSLFFPAAACAQESGSTQTYDVVVVGGTPGGIMAAIGAARGGRSVLLLERTSHLGGLPANGLGATDIATRGATGGLFLEFTRANLDFYTRTFGPDSPQVKVCSGGYHFEPSVGEKSLQTMLTAYPKVRVLLRRQFDALPENVRLEKGRLAEIRVEDLEGHATEHFLAGVFIDATYEGDLAAAAGVPYRLGRENQWDFQEPMAGQMYKEWAGPLRDGSTGLGDNGVQAYNYRLPLTNRPDLRVPITQPPHYRREEYASIIEDLKLNRTTAAPDAKRGEMAWDSIGRVVNMVALPNGKTDANHQHAAFISTDLSEENWPWPTSSWAWRDRYAERLREYTLGLLWFVQNDPELPEDFRARCREWGLARDEYQDNGNFPRQVYVREGRRIEGEYLFTAHDALPLEEGGRPPIHASSITASHYSLDSHAVHKREPGRVINEGFFSYPTKPYTVPYGVMVPKKVDGLLTPVPVSGTHVGFSTLRMEPCWMALGQAAGVAASLGLEQNVPVRNVDLARLQSALLDQGAVLIYYRDTPAEHPHFKALQYFGLRGMVPGWEARLDAPVSEADAQAWFEATKLPPPTGYRPGQTSRGELLELLHTAAVKN